MSGRIVFTVLSLITLALVRSACLPAATYYVDQGHPRASDDNPGTKASPWRTINHAARVLRAGDTVVINEGTYNVGASRGWAAPAVNPAHGGTKGNPITFKACPGHRVTIATSGGQAALGSNRDYVVWDGFIVDMKDRMKGIIIYGAKGCVIRYCEVIGNRIATRDNHDGIRIERAPDCCIHHNIIRGVQGNSPNSAGIKVYSKGAKNVIAEDNYICDNTAGVFDKDFGVDNTYRRNYFTRNRTHFYGNNQGGPARYYIYDNVFDGKVELHAGNAGTEIHDNLFRSNSLAGAWAGGVVGTSIWNNIVISKARSITACQNKRQALTAALAYMDYNIYDAQPAYDFGQYTSHHQRFSLGQMRSRRFEQNSRVVSGAQDVFEDQRSYQLLPRWQTAGRDGHAVGPEDIASGLDLGRYGPSAVRASVSPKRKETEEDVNNQ